MELLCPFCDTPLRKVRARASDRGGGRVGLGWVAAIAGLVAVLGWWAGRPRTPDPAAPLLAACEQGHGGACRQLAELYAAGGGGPRHGAQAQQAVQRICRSEAAAARGARVPTEGPEEANGPLSSAALACIGLGRLQETGRLVARDHQAAAQSYLRACRDGWQDGCARLHGLWAEAAAQAPATACREPSQYVEFDSGARLCAQLPPDAVDRCRSQLQRTEWMYLLRGKLPPCATP